MWIDRQGLLQKRKRQFDEPKVDIEAAEIVQIVRVVGFRLDREFEMRNRHSGLLLPDTYDSHDVVRIGSTCMGAEQRQSPGLGKRKIVGLDQQADLPDLD